MELMLLKMSLEEGECEIITRKKTRIFSLQMTYNHYLCMVKRHFAKAFKFQHHFKQ